jgi:peroxiredoxin
VQQGPAGLKDVRGVEIGHAFVERTTFVVTGAGRIAATIKGVAPDKNVEQALDAVEHLSKSRPGG